MSFADRPGAHLAGWLAALLLAPAAGASSHLVEVAKDGSGDFATIQAAIDHAPAGAANPTVIHVAAGHYFEKLTVPSDRGPLVLVGDGRDATVLEYDESFIDGTGALVAMRVLTNYADDLVIRSLAIRNLAKEPGGSGGKWDAAVQNYGDRLVLNDVLLRADHDTLLMYGPAFGAGPGPSRVYVHDSHIQGRGDFIASFSSVFIEDSVLETIRDRSHFLFQLGVPGALPAEQDALVVRNTRFTGQSNDPFWPAGVTNLCANARVYLVRNIFEFDLGANRPIAFFHASTQPFSSSVKRYGNSQSRSTLSPLLWSSYSVPGPLGTPRLDLPVTLNDFGEPIVQSLSRSAADAVTPLWLFGDWDPRQEEPLSACEDGLDNDGDGLTDLSGEDPGCASLADFSEAAPELACDNGVDDDSDRAIDVADTGCSDALDPSERGGSDWSCGLGPELALVIPLLVRAGRRRRGARIRQLCSVAGLVGVACLALACRPEPRAFPGAEGQGASSRGGRGGAVIFVDSRADSGPGTLRAALEASGPRTVIFRVGGTITLQSPLVISNPYVTVAGQTAPGGGIQLRNDPVAPYGLAADSFTSLVIATHDVVIRYLRIRPGPLQPNPACTGPNAVAHPAGLKTCVDAGDIQAIELEQAAERVMLDHLSLAWASDEIVDLNGASEVSLQWSILAEGMAFVLYEGFFGGVGGAHGHGVIIGDAASTAAGLVNGRLSFHHDLFGLLMDRAPQITVNCPNPAQGPVCASDVVNNYVYGWRDHGTLVANNHGHSYVNVSGNYFRAGPDTRNVSGALRLSDWGRSPLAAVPDAVLAVHLSGNRVQLSSGVSQNAEVLCKRWNETVRRWEFCNAGSYSSERYGPAITTTGAALARSQVLADAGASRRLDSAGAWRAARDSADARVVADASTGTGRIMSDYDDFPGWPSLSKGSAPDDADHDGMPDDWEDLQCLDAGRADAALDADGDGYTNLEEYLNGEPAC